MDSTPDDLEEGHFHLAYPFGHHMVLQREPREAVIWGWCHPKDMECEVIVSLEGQILEAVRSEVPQTVGKFQQIRWEARLLPQPASGPFSISFQSGRGSFVLHDVYFGEVFACTGQSNMAFSIPQTFVEREEEEEEEGNTYSFPYIRVMSVGQKSSETLLADWDSPPKLPWSVASREVLHRGARGDLWDPFSAVCWYYGKELFEQLQIPIGLVEMTVGGSRLQVSNQDPRHFS